MKVNVSVDCTPEEARAFLGLPDLTPINDKYVQQLMEAMDGASNLEQLEKMMRTFSPMGETGLRFFQQMMELGTGMKGKS